MGRGVEQGPRARVQDRGVTDERGLGLCEVMVGAL